VKRGCMWRTRALVHQSAACSSFFFFSFLCVFSFSAKSTNLRAPRAEESAGSPHFPQAPIRLPSRARVSRRVTRADESRNQSQAGHDAVFADGGAPASLRPESRSLYAWARLAAGLFRCRRG